MVPEKYTKSLSEMGYSIGVGNDAVKGRTLFIKNAGKPTPHTTIPAGTLLLQEQCLFTVCSFSEANHPHCSYCVQTPESLKEYRCTDSVPAFKKCSACKLAFYCSESCQMADWKVGGHKALCKMYQMYNLAISQSKFKESPLPPAGEEAMRATLTYLALKPKRPELEEAMNAYRMGE